MRRGWWRSLRVRLAVLGFGAVYLPALLLFGVILLTDTETEVRSRDGTETSTSATTHAAPWLTWTLVALAPVAAGIAWWWAGRAVGPIDRMRRVVEQIEAADLDRRTGLDSGPAEIVSLAASFDAMLDRLERAAQTQRRLIEETSHELRLPLSVLVTNAEVLLAHRDPTVALYREGLARSRRAAVRLRTTLDQLLVDARGRARTLDRRPADVVVLVRHVLADAAVLADGRAVELALTGLEAAVCPVDGPTVTRAVSNLVDNAIRHAPAGSTVEVAVEVAGAELAVVVTDHGPGIPAAERERVFQRFWRGNGESADTGGAGGTGGTGGTGESGGTGLGLPIALHIAQAHGGTLTLTSPGPAGDGCAFRLTLRRAAGG